MSSRLPTLAVADVREAWRSGREIALLDAREEDPFAQAHPLFAAQMPLSRVELDAPWRLPRRDVPIATYDDGEGLAERLAARLRALGYTRVALLEGGLQGWRRAGAELFIDVNVPSKAFGELVEHERGTPSLPAPEVKALLDAGADVVVLDARRFDEYQTMSIPQGISVPGAELVLRVRDLAPDPATRVIVNCAGRTRSLIGAQSLINAGIPNPVAALRNGTIGWTLAGLALEHGQSRRFGPTAGPALAEAQRAAQALAERAGVQRWRAMPVLPANRTVYCYDVRTPEEYAAGHRPGFGSAPGGQLVQETDHCAPVRGALIVLADSEGVRAPMTAHWLAQMGWEVAWLDDGAAAEGRSPWPPSPALPEVPRLPPAPTDAGTLFVDVGPGAAYVRRHVAGALWALRSRWPDLLAAAQARCATRLLLTADDERLACFAAAELQALAPLPVAVVAGGNAAAYAAGLPSATGEEALASPRIDRYRRPYEGTDNPQSAMQAYLDWEFGLVAQLGRDGTHRFRVLPAA